MKKLALLILLLLVTMPAVASVNVLSGNLSHRQELFSTSGGPLPLRMQLRYNSFDRIAGQVGTGWSHSFQIYLHENSDGTLVLTGGVGKRFYFLNSNTGLYEPRIADKSSLTADAIGYTINFPSGTVYQFGTDKKISSITDRHGNALTFTYDDTANQLTVSSVNKQVLIQFDANGRVNYIQDPATSQFDFTYTDGLLESVSYPDPDGGTNNPLWLYSYTADGLLELITDPNLQTSKYIYGQGRVVRTVAPEGVMGPDGAETTDAVTKYSKTY